jgi:hypothetical protein
MERMNIYTLLEGPAGGLRGGPTRPAEGCTSLGHVIPAANTATCLAQVKALPKPHRRTCESQGNSSKLLSVADSHGSGNGWQGNFSQ